MIGCSLDGDISNFSGIIELKVPKSTTHVSLYSNPNYKGDAWRRTWEQPRWTHNLVMRCTGAEWCDFASFDDLEGA